MYIVVRSGLTMHVGAQLECRVGFDALDDGAAPATDSSSGAWCAAGEGWAHVQSAPQPHWRRPPVHSPPSHPGLAGLIAVDCANGLAVIGRCSDVPYTDAIGDGHALGVPWEGC